MNTAPVTNPEQSDLSFEFVDRESLNHGYSSAQCLSPLILQYPSQGSRIGRESRFFLSLDIPFYSTSKKKKGKGKGKGKSSKDYVWTP